MPITRAREAEPETHRWRGRIGALLAGAGALVLYAACAFRDLVPGDSPELSAAMHTFGIAHSPGYPLYTMVSGLLVRVLFFLEPAHASHLTSALYGAVSVALLHALGSRLGLHPAAALLACGTLVLGRTFWSQAILAEVYTFDALWLALTLHAALSHARSPRPRNALLLLTAAGLWVGHRLVNVLYAPAVALFWWAGGGRKVPAPRMLAPAAVLALLPFLYLPLVSSRDPYLDRGDPETLDQLLWLVTAEDYGRHLEGSADLSRRRFLRAWGSVPWEVGLGVLLAAWGLVHRRKPWPMRAALAYLLLVNVAFSARFNILDVHVYYIPAWFAASLLAGLGLDRVSRQVSRRGARLALLGSVLVLAPAWLWIGNARQNVRPGDPLGRWLAQDMLASVPENGVLFARGDFTEPLLWFAQSVEGQRPDVVIVDPVQLREFDWYEREVLQRYPDVPWPAAAREGPARAEAMLEFLVRERPVSLLFSVNPAQMLDPEDLSSGKLVERGLSLRWYPSPPPAAEERASADFNRELFARVRERWGEPREPRDLPARWVQGYYALAQFQCALLGVRTGRNDTARELLEGVLALDPDRIDAEIREAFRTTGMPHPSTELEKRSRELLRQL